uniref:NADH-ubiquinone oxidoreductase chain 4L n=1 Tax=Florometra sp. BMK-2020 TaxID=2719553 RepID=A0A6G9FTE0_9ECHI|nr:NADH dehydrogenase subunit 4L [Florometra sp. BMK-2020]UFJ44012.1 NADH dehydrogenase subunit 4L [Oligometra serripinna]
MKFVYFVVCFVFFLGVFGILLNRYHLLTMMLCLELLLVCLFINFSIFVGIYNNLSFSSFSLILLTFSACEVSVGLSFLVLISRFFGNNNVFSLNLLRL